MKKVYHYFITPFFVMGVFLFLLVSCQKGDEDNPNQGGTVKDIEGNIYHTVTIGTQVWMAENLKTTKYRNGDPISSNMWDYNNDPTTGKKYGKLYDWYAVNDDRNIAPAGWHVATDEDWETLEYYLSTHLSNSGSVAKALASKTDWISSKNIGAVGNDLSKNNSSGFNALPAGYRSGTGEFKGLGLWATWWSSTSYGNSSYLAYQWSMGFDESFIGSESGGSVYGFSVRCVKD